MTQELLGTSNQFVVLFDSPTVRDLLFPGAGNIDVFNIGSGLSRTIGTVLDDAPMHVEVLFDIVADRWEIRIDDALLYSDVIGATAVTSVRYSHGSSGAGDADPVATSYLDNVAILASDMVELPAPVPLPGAVWLLLSGLSWLALGRHRRAGSLASPRPPPSLG